MKILTIFLYLLSGLVAMAQQAQKPIYSQLSKSINDDGKTLAIDIAGEQVNGQKIRYKHAFDVDHFSAEQKEALKNRVLDSLGVNDVPTSPKSPQASTETVTFTCESCTGKGRVEVYGNGITSTRIIDSRQDENHSFPLRLQLGPGDYRPI